MISKEDFDFISQFDGADASTRMALIQQNPHQLPKTFMNLLSQISKDATIQYLLTLLDDVLQEDKARVEMFKTYFEKKKVKTESLKNYVYINHNFENLFLRNLYGRNY